MIADPIRAGIAGGWKVVGDNDTITIHERREFIVVAPDDNS